MDGRVSRQLGRVPDRHLTYMDAAGAGAGAGLVGGLSLRREAP